MENIKPIDHEWAKARMIYHRDAAETFKEQRDSALRKNATLWSWLCLSAVLNAIFIGFTIFFYFKTH